MVILRRNLNNSNQWLPVRSIMDDFNKLPDLWDDMTSSFGKTLSSDIWEEQDAVYIKVILPGVDPELVDISIVGDMVTIKGEMKEEQETENKKKDY